LPNNISDLSIEEKFKKSKNSSRIVACLATIHAAIVINKADLTFLLNKIRAKKNKLFHYL